MTDSEPTFEELDSEPVKKVSIERLEPHPDNPREGDVSAIKDSIKRFGFNSVIVAHKSTGHILAGNHRFEAARQLGFNEVPVMWLKCDAHEAKAFMLADNKTADRAGYDEEELAGVLESLGSSDDDFQGTGFESEELEGLVDGLTESINEPAAGTPASSELTGSELDTSEVDINVEDSEQEPEKKRVVLRVDAFEFEAITTYFEKLTNEFDDLTTNADCVRFLIDYRRNLELAKSKVDAFEV